ncbi:MAG: hypothetical protein Q8876_10400, partial [Bacillota bacterium]|nr:hypothetical protein [Bacillota bacterium]
YGECDEPANPYIHDVCGEIWVDVNGLKGPNILGLDNFWFYLSSDGRISPTGSKGESWGYSFDERCKNYSINHDGMGCTAWVLQNENLDYRKCSNLSWDGPTTCP